MIENADSESVMRIKMAKEGIGLVFSWTYLRIWT